MKKIILSMMAACAMLFATSCENGDVEFDDFDYQTVSFAKQTPVRTIVLGESEYPNELDNQHKFKLQVTLGGSRNLNKEHKVKIVVDNGLCDGLTFSDGHQVTPLPAEYYQLPSDIITIPAGKAWDGIEVQLTDAFFADPKALSLNYVLPVRIVEALDGDSILAGQKKQNVENPVWQNAANWDVAPQNYQLLALVYKNPYHGAWISHGTDNIDFDGTTSEVNREAEYFERNEIRYLTTNSLLSSNYNVSTLVPITTINSDGNEESSSATLTSTLKLDFDNAGNIVVSTANTDAMNVPKSSTNATWTYTVSGTGKWEQHAAKKAWADKDRDQITLDYVLTFFYSDKGVQHVKKYTCHDILVFRDHQKNFENFDITYNK
ncbi:MAG TPA: hypothetical protein DDW28_03820 [Prevotella sp.]|nr:hypothetical protein [Candidatus Segatella violae]